MARHGVLHNVCPSIRLRLATLLTDVFRCFELWVTMQPKYFEGEIFCVFHGLSYELLQNLTLKILSCIAILKLLCFAICKIFIKMQKAIKSQNFLTLEIFRLQDSYIITACDSYLFSLLDARSEAIMFVKLSIILLSNSRKFTYFSHRSHLLFSKLCLI